MSNFLRPADWSFPVPIFYGPSRINELGKLCKVNGIHRPLIVTDRGSAHLPFIKQTQDILNAENFKTSEGCLFPIYKYWEDKNKEYMPMMVYATTIAPKVEKGPILHERRRGYLTAIKGVVDVQCMVNGKIETYKILDENGNQNILMIPEGIQNKIINKSEEEAIVINLPDRSWYPFDEDTKKYSDWKWED